MGNKTFWKQETTSCDTTIEHSEVLDSVSRTSSKISQINFTAPNHEYHCISINKYLIRNIISYIEPRVILSDLLLLNKSLCKLFNLKAFEKNFFFSHEIDGAQKFDDFYCEININEILSESNIPCKNLLNVELEIESMEEGWSTISCSDSWVEIKASDQHNATEVRGAFNLKKNNFAKGYSTTKISLRKSSEKENGSKILEQLRHDNGIFKIYARSMYPGWICFVRNIKIRFLYFDIDLG